MKWDPEEMERLRVMFKKRGHDLSPEATVSAMDNLVRLFFLVARIQTRTKSQESNEGQSKIV